ncbi:MAG: WD40 repeat domain-containing protein, partial [Pseudonocardiaceae bacterium]
FTLAQLAEGVTRGGRLSRARYDQLGGVQGALTRQADTALTDAVTAGGRSREQVIAGLLRLVTVDEQGSPTRWRVLRNELPGHVVAEMNAFVARRLLTTDTDNGTVVIGVAHEAFLSAWPPLSQAITAAASALRARRAVEHAATEWHNGGRPPARLWGGGQLAAVVADTSARICAGSAPPLRQEAPARWILGRHRELVTDRVDLSPKAREFLHTSIRHDRYRRRRATTVLSVLLILALVGAMVAVLQRRDAEEQKQIAIVRALVARADATRDTDPRTALQLGIAAHRIHADGTTHDNLVKTLTATRYAGVLTGHHEAVRSVTFSPNGQILAGSDHSEIVLWNFANPAQPRRLGQPLTGHTKGVWSMAFSSDGKTLATGSEDHTVILWDLTNPAEPHRLRQPLRHREMVSSVAFSPDGKTLATGSSDRTVTLWDVTNPSQPTAWNSPLVGHGAPVLSVVFSPNGKTLASGSADGTAILWDLTDPAHPHRSRNVITYSFEGRMV